MKRSLELARKKIKKIGVALHLSPIAPNVLIAKVNDYLDPGLIVYNDDLEPIGTIIEIFGPTNAPYARIKVEKKDFHLDEHSPLFIIMGEKKKVIWRKMPGYKRIKGLKHG